MKKLLLFLLLLVKLKPISAQSDQDEQYLLRQNLPIDFSDAITSGLDSDLELSDFINPFYLLADLNGDAQMDIAVAVKEKKTAKVGLIIYHGGNEDSYRLGAGNTIGNGGDDFGWMNIWNIHPKTTVEPGVGETEDLQLIGEAIYVAKAEAASAVIYWNGSEYMWYHQGD